MVVGDLHAVGVSVFPNEADAVPIVDSDTVSPFPGAFQGLQAVAWDGRQISKRFRLVQMDELPERDLFDGPISVFDKLQDGCFKRVPSMIRSPSLPTIEAAIR
jgi:hypothetical protein